MVGRIEKNVRINGVMIKILIETRTKWECAEAAGSSNFNMGFLSSILQGFSSLPVLFPRSVHITAFCHPSLLELWACAGHFSRPHHPRVSSTARALASATARVRVLWRQTSSRWKEKCGWLRMRQTLKKYPSALIHWPVMTCLSASQVKPIYSPVPLTTNFGQKRRQQTQQYTGACRGRRE